MRYVESKNVMQERGIDNANTVNANRGGATTGIGKHRGDWQSLLSANHAERLS